jgi:hypothetical protein
MKTIKPIIICAFIVLTSFSVTKHLVLKTPTTCMSSTHLKFISTNPDFIPSQSQKNQAKAFINSIFNNTEIEFNETKDIEFVDQGSNFESISCNICGRIIDNDYWQHTMDKAYETHFKVLTFITPCCHKKTSLNDLQYHWPAGFAKFQISILDPVGDIKTTEVSELEKILGTKVRKIWAHY